MGYFKFKVLPHWVTNSIQAHPFVPGKEINVVITSREKSVILCQFHVSGPAIPIPIPSSVIKRKNKRAYLGKESLGNFFNRS